MKPKLTHIVRFRSAGDFNAFARCGRRVSWMSTVYEIEDGATCPKCIAEHLAITTQAAQPA